MAKSKNKFYAVRKGFQPGIYKTWAECQKQVLGFKGAEFKGFTAEEDAIFYLNNKTQSSDNKSKDVNFELQKTKELSSKPNSLVVYIDGSYSSKIPNCPYSYGMAIIKNNDIIFKDNGFGEDEDAKSMNNVAGELLGAMKSVLYIANNYKDVKNIYLFHDYEGIAAWVKGKWKTKNRMTKQYVEFIEKVKQNYKLNVDFVKVKGHKGNPFNELVDKLAKDALTPFKQTK